jgi:hypothetical protein
MYNEFLVTDMAFSLTVRGEKDGARRTAKIHVLYVYVQTTSFRTCSTFVILALGKVCCTLCAVFESQGLIEMSNLSFRGRPHRCFCMNFGV